MDAVADQVSWLPDGRPSPPPGLTIVVPGIPVPQGSLKAFKTRAGGIAVTSDNPRTRPWKAAVTAAAADAVTRMKLPTPAFDRRPVTVVVTFRLPRPKAHYGTRGLLPSAPAVPAGMPDLDKLVRAVLDALTGVVWRDDSQVVSIGAVKRYPDEGARLETEIHVGAGS